MVVTRRAWLWVGLLAVGLLTLSFGAQVGGAFVWDDAWFVERNPSLHGLAGLLDNFRLDFYHAAGQAPGQFYRPLMMATVWLQSVLGASSVAPYRLFNFVLHLACATLLLCLLLRLVTGSTSSQISQYS